MFDCSTFSKSEADTREAQTVLIVEDTLAFQELIVEAVSELRANWYALCVPTAEEALAVLEQHDFEPELILVDLGLPDISGIEVIQSARLRFPEIPIMVISMIASNDSVIKAIQAGARGYIQKGDSSISIAHAISRVLDGDYPISPSLAQYLFRLVGQGNPNPIEVQAPLTDKEMQVLKLLGRGYTYTEAALEMNIAVSTVQYHVKNTYLKLEVNSRAKAVAKAQSQGWL